MPTLGRGRRLLYWAILLGGLALFSWAASVVGRSTAGYLYVKKQPPGWWGTVARADARLGFAGVPGSAGAEILPGGEREPVRFDADGLRIPMAGSDGSARRPLVLALGDSFTFGTGCRAEETYPSRIARALGGSVHNAGYPGYGLAQMWVLGRELLPRYRPDLLLVQASTWLPDRASRPLRRSGFGLLPVPWFAAGEQGPVWRAPLFTSKLFDLPIARYRDTTAGPVDWGGFVARVGLPLFLHDDARRVQMRVSRTVGRLPRGAEEQEISRTVYPALARLARESGARMVVVVLEAAGKQNLISADLGLPGDVLVVDTKPGLYGGITGTDKDTYLRAYGHWRGKPPRLVDEHPNPRAQAIIAAQVLAALSPSP